MTDSGSSSPGFIDSIRKLGHGLISSVHDRIELFSIELQQEKLRIIEVLILINAAIFSAFLALILLTWTVIYLFPARDRPYVLGGFTVIYAGSCIGVILVLKRKLVKLASPFEATRQELAADRDALKPAE